jgi:hypothetical protein
MNISTLIIVILSKLPVIPLYRRLILIRYQTSICPPNHVTEGIRHLQRQSIHYLILNSFYNLYQVYSFPEKDIKKT